MIGSVKLPVTAGGTPTDGYVRPTDWLTLPTVLDTDQKFVGLFAVFNHDSNFVALNCASNYTVDWGDGVVEDIATGVSAYHLYDYNYAGFVGTETTGGYRQAIVTITPQDTFNFTKVDLNVKHNQAGLNAYSGQWLDIVMAGSNINNLIISGSTLRNKMLEQFDFKGTNSITELYSTFLDATSLVKVVDLYTNAVTSFQATFYGCISLKEIPLFNTSAATTLVAAFSGCKSLEVVPLFDTPLVLSWFTTFYNCASLREVPLFNTVSATTVSDMFNGCDTLKDLPLFNLVNLKNASNFLKNCATIQTLPLFDLSAVTNAENMVNGCVSLENVPDFNLSNATNLNNTFVGATSLSKISATGMKVTFSINGLKLSTPAIVEIFNNLATVTGQTLTITNNWGTAGLTASDKLIATDKGWTLVE